MCSQSTFPEQREYRKQLLPDVVLKIFKNRYAFPDAGDINVEALQLSTVAQPGSTC